MHRIYPLFSSSKGNCTYITTKTGGILIDCGVSYSRICKALELCGLSIKNIHMIFITHEHSDHICGLKMLTKKTGIPVAAQSYTADILFDKGMICSSCEEMKEYIDVDGVKVSCFNTSHDTRESCGYRIDYSDGRSCGICTDLGYINETVRNALSGCSTVLLEANYDEEMMRTGPYPVYLKERIRSKFGHLSNTDSGNFASELVKGGTSGLILGHLSQENNTPQIAEYTVESIIAQSGAQRGRDYFLSCAPIETKGVFISF